jgi:hypothetical protein
VTRAECFEPLAEEASRGDRRVDDPDHPIAARRVDLEETDDESGGLVFLDERPDHEQSDSILGFVRHRRSVRGAVSHNRQRAVSWRSAERGAISCSILGDGETPSSSASSRR